MTEKEDLSLSAQKLDEAIKNEGLTDENIKEINRLFVKTTERISEILAKAERKYAIIELKKEGYDENNIPEEILKKKIEELNKSYPPVLTRVDIDIYEKMYNKVRAGKMSLAEFLKEIGLEWVGGT